MQFLTLIKFDVYHGIIKKFYYYIFFALFILICCLGFIIKINSFEYDFFTLGDIFFYLHSGIKEYIPSPDNPFEIPYLWILNHILILYFTLNYMSNDLIGFGQNMIFRAKSRSVWWMSKCIYTLVSVIIFYVLSFLIICLFTLYKGGTLSFEISEYMWRLMNLGDTVLNEKPKSLITETIVMPFFTSLALSILQMFLCLLMKPILSYIVSIVMLISSAYYFSPFLLGNYSMAVRSNRLIENGFNVNVGVAYAFIIIVISIILGLLIFKKYNILNSKE